MTSHILKIHAYNVSMDTILYFYPLKNRTVTHSFFDREEYESSMYRLIKLGLTPEALSLLEQEIPCKWWNLKQRRRRARREKERESLLREVQALWGENCSTYCVCREPITYFQKWEFTDYRETKWVMYLLQKSSLPHFAVLGKAFCLWEVLPRMARKMKSLRVFLWESQFTQDLEGLLEDLFEEYGIAADVHFLAEEEGYRKLPSMGPLPCNVLDFSGEEQIRPGAAAPGSFWFDFDSLKGKRCRIEAKAREITYVSLLKEWENP